MKASGYGEDFVMRLPIRASWVPPSPLSNILEENDQAPRASIEAVNKKNSTRPKAKVGCPHCRESSRDDEEEDTFFSVLQPNISSLGCCPHGPLGGLGQPTTSSLDPPSPGRLRRQQYVDPVLVPGTNTLSLNIDSTLTQHLTT